MALGDFANKIAALLASADDMSYPDAIRAGYRAKALELMDKYNLAEEEALASDPTSSLPIIHTILIRKSGQGNGDLGHMYRTIMEYIARHTGVRLHVKTLADWGQSATVVGYEGDVRYTELLWTSAYLMFATRIDPTWDASKSEVDNIFFMRQAGIERRRIADMAWGNGDDSTARAKVQRIYKQEAARRNEDVLAAGLGFNTKQYRESYAQAFVLTLNRRLREARDAADSVHGQMVFAGRSARVDEAFYTKFPTLRPSNLPVPAADAWVDPTTTCAKCAKAKTTCREHTYMRPRAWTATDEARAYRRENGTSARAGKASGRAAAEAVGISRTERANRLDASGVAIEG